MNTFADQARRKDAQIKQSIQEKLDAAAIRYIFTPFESLIVQSLPNGAIPAGRITPISITDQPIGSIYLQPMLEANPEKERDFNIINGVGVVEVAPRDIMAALRGQYKSHVFAEINALSNFPIDVWTKLQFEDFLCKEETNTITSYVEWIKHFESCHKRMEAGAVVTGEERIAKYKPYYEILYKAIEEMRATVEACRVELVLEANEKNILLGKPMGINKFSVRDYRVFEFTGITPRDEALNQLAEDRKQIPNLLQQIAKGTTINIEALGDAIGKGLAKAMKEQAPAASEPTATEKAEQKLEKAGLRK